MRRAKAFADSASREHQIISGVGFDSLKYFPTQISYFYTKMSTRENSSSVRLTRAEQETQTKADRLNEQIEAALAAVAVRTRDDPEELEARADRLERAARDLSVALRELARERRRKREEKD
jgi:hypothetical protein